MTFSRVAPALLLALTLPALPNATAQRGQRANQQNQPSTPAPSESTPAATAPAPGAPTPPPGTPQPPEHTQPLPNPLPTEKSVEQTITVNGKTLHYTATVGTI